MVKYLYNVDDKENIMESLNVNIVPPYVFVYANAQTMVIPSFVLSTLMACFLTTFMPYLAPVWMQQVVTPYKAG